MQPTNLDRAVDQATKSDIVAQKISRGIRILYVATRFPVPATDGRKVMINQVLSFCSRLGQLHFCYFDKMDYGPSIPNDLNATSMHFLPSPSLGTVIGDLARRPTAPLQSHLLSGNAARERLLRVIANERPDVVVFDMIRTSSLAEAVRRKCPDLPIVLDLDDLLSERYRRMLTQKNNHVISAFGQRMPLLLRYVARTLPTVFLRLEARLMARSEVRAPTLYDAAICISGTEADIWRRKIDAPKDFVIRDVPPVLKPSLTKSSNLSFTEPLGKELRFVFIGNALQFGNMEALKALDRIAKRLKDALPPDALDLSFHSAGQINHSLNLSHIKQHGYVDDLSAFLRGPTVMVVPLMTGTGIKLKLLDAFTTGTPVVTTSVGAESLNLIPDKHYILAEDEQSFCEVLTKIAIGSISFLHLSSIAKSAKKHIAKENSDRAVFSRFKTVIDAAIMHRARYRKPKC